MTVCAQTKLTDSLKLRIKTTGSEKEKLSAIIKLSELSLNADTLLYYVIIAESIAAKK